MTIWSELSPVISWGGGRITPNPGPHRVSLLASRLNSPSSQVFTASLHSLRCKVGYKSLISCQSHRLSNLTASCAHTRRVHSNSCCTVLIASALASLATVCNDVAQGSGRETYQPALPRCIAFHHLLGLSQRSRSFIPRASIFRLQVRRSRQQQLHRPASSSCKGRFTI